MIRRTIVRLRPVLPLLLLLLLCILLSSSTCQSLRMRRRRKLFTSCRTHHNKKALAGSRKGTVVAFGRPTVERCSKWFPTQESPPYNHETAGMTNPSLHIAVNNQVVMHISASKTTRPITSTTNPQFTASSTQQQQQQQEEPWWPSSMAIVDESSDRWRIKRLRKRVGFGRQCYEHVRTKALAWDFEVRNKGMRTCQPKQMSIRRFNPIRHESRGYGYDVVHTTTTTQSDSYYYHNNGLFDPKTKSRNFLSIQSRGGKRLVTFLNIGNILTICNPVRVVYELCDERAPHTTYTSTAYATLGGHWLAGEERVTVALRDDGHVDVEVLSLSGPSQSLLSKLVVWPLVGRFQDSFFEAQMEYLQNNNDDANNDANNQSNNMLRLENNIHHGIRLPISL